MKTKEELSALKDEYEALTQKLRELTEDELKQVTGGWHWGDNWGDGTYADDIGSANGSKRPG